MDNQASLPLFDDCPINDSLAITPNDADNLLEDYAATGLSTHDHPVALLHREKSLNYITTADKLQGKAHKSVVKVLGCVTGRQAPGTAAGVTFLTLEDHTGNMNVVVWVSTARAQQPTFLKAKLLQVNGVIERSKEGVIHIIAGKLIDRTPWLASLSLTSRDFH